MDSDSWDNLDFDPYWMPRKRKSKDRGWMVGCMVFGFIASLLIGIFLAGTFYWLAGGELNFEDSRATRAAIAQTQTLLAVTPTFTPSFTPTITLTPTPSPTQTMQATVLDEETATPSPTFFRVVGPLPTVMPDTDEQVAQFWARADLLILVQRDGVTLYNPTTPDINGIPLVTISKNAWQSAALRPDGELLAIVDTVGQVEVWDVTTQLIVGFRANDTPISQMAFVDETQLAWITESGDLALWSINGGEPRAIAKRPGALSLAVNGDGSLVALGFASSTIEIWDIEAKTPRQTFKNNLFGFVQQVVFIPNTLFLAVRNESGAITVYHRVTGEIVSRLPTAAVSFALGREKQLLTADQENRLELWDYQEGKRILSIDLSYSPATVALRPDGKAVAVIGRNGEFEVWTLDSDTPQRLIEIHPS